MVTAVKQNSSGLRYASESLKNDKYFMLDAIRQNKGVNDYTLFTLQIDPDIKRLYQQGYKVLLD
jgi:hypothetical protein